MSMFCYQCQETAKNTGCTKVGVCGKTDDLAGIQDVMMYLLKGLSVYAEIARKNGIENKEVNHFTMYGLFMTITNGNFNKSHFYDKILEGMHIKSALENQLQNADVDVNKDQLPEPAKWYAYTPEEFESKASQVGILQMNPEEDIRSLRELLTYGVKGMAAYAEHAYNLGYKDENIYAFMHKALAATLDDTLSVDELTQMVLDCGQKGVETMALLDKANTSTYGNPELTKVNLGVRNNPAILISGHDLRDMEDLLEQTKNTGVDVYTHSEMLPANYYPAFKKYEHFVGNYGNSWWKQREEFENFNGPILFTTNCIVPPSKKESYTDRIYTTGAAGLEGATHIPERKENGRKDFSQIIKHAKKCKPPEQIEEGEIVGGFAHNQVIQLADKVVDAVKSGAIRKFFVMAGCDGRMKDREYYTEFAEKLPEDTVILTAGCAKYRYNKLPLGAIDGIPRVLDAGQCNDSYSLAVIALKLKEVFELNDINDLPIAYNIAWYEQKAVIVLLSLLSLGVKNIHLGPTLPAFLSPNVAKVLVDKFDIASIGTVDEDLKLFLS